jgi:hypothetical protein
MMATFKYSIDSEIFANWFKIEDNKVEKNDDGDYILKDDDDTNYYKLDCYTKEDGGGYYYLYWKINDEQSDVDKKISSSKVYKRLTTKWSKLWINTSSAFAMASCGWDEEEIEEEEKVAQIQPVRRKLRITSQMTTDNREKLLQGSK